jgi:hypothetical protein
VLLLLGACSGVRLAYHNAPQLAWWWIDDYVDFSRAQAPLARKGLEQYFEWHRSTQLPQWAALLAAAQAEVGEPTTAPAACRWEDQVRQQLEPSLERALALAADLLPGLGAAQFKNLEQRFAKGNAEMSDDFLQPDPALRLAESIRRALDRASRLYGPLDEAQEQVVREGVAASPFNPELWRAERLRRQRDTVQTLRRLVSEGADRDARLAALRVLAVRVERSPDPEYRAYQLRLTDYNCAFAAQLHNATTPAQRRRARDNLKGWEDDLRALAAGN